MSVVSLVNDPVMAFQERTRQPIQSIPIIFTSALVTHNDPRPLLPILCSLSSHFHLNDLYSPSFFTDLRPS
jgi:hypothetical protein